MTRRALVYLYLAASFPVCGWVAGVEGYGAWSCMAVFASCVAAYLFVAKCVRFPDEPEDILSQHPKYFGGPAIHVRVHAVVDPCGRVLIGEVEKLLPGETWHYAPPAWYHDPAAVTHTIDLLLPVPLLTTPRITWHGDVHRGVGLRVPEESSP